ncbi:MAG: ATP-binding protein [Lachnospiraceae bacterium]|nr:ATP-binding protein [Lachnospiraceae bacterium]
MKKRRPPIGIDNFEKLVKDGFYYVDKTGMIRELLENWGEVNLFTRPRRFGKSLNMSMLQHFFEIGADSSLFNGLTISGETALCAEWQGKYPVISLTLKDCWGLDYQDALEQFAGVVSREVDRHAYLMDSEKLDEADKQTLLDMKMKRANLESAIMVLSGYLNKHWGQPVIVLIDEYDVPLQKAESNGYYNEMTSFISRFFSQGMKTNSNIKMAVVTGCLRIAKESIFTGFNNPRMHTIADESYDEWFGFTDQEVRQMLEYYGISEYYDVTREWYDGYLFGKTSVYSPWDVLNWCDQLMNTSDRIPRNFWSNASGNDIIRRFADQADKQTRDQIAELIEGGTVNKQVKPDLTYRELDDTIDNLWSVLFTTGYLTMRGRNEDGSYILTIPNREVRELFAAQVDEWFQEKVLDDTDGLREFLNAILAEDETAMEDCLIDYMEGSISYLDGGKTEEKENFYHGLLLGMLASFKEWNVVSNREAGKGRLDILAYRRREKYAFIIEVKYAKEAADLETDAKKALSQIDDRKYDKVFGRHLPERIVHYGIAFCKTDCRVMKEVARDGQL